MVVADWTFPALVVVLDSDVPSGSSAPSLNVTADATVRLIYPTSGTINGSDIRGLDSGVIEVWMKSGTRDTTAHRVSVFSRCTNTTAATFTGYSARLVFKSTGDTVDIFRHSSSSTGTSISSTATSSALAANTWYHFKFTWTVQSANLLLQIAVDFGSGYVDQIGSGGFLDTSPLSTGSSTQTCGIYLAAQGFTWKMDDFKVYSV